MDIEANRKARKYTRKELIGRMLWAACSPLFRYSPRLMWGWRRFLLRSFGAKVGKKVNIMPTVKVFIPWQFEIGDWSCIGFDALIYNLGEIKIGENVTVSQRAHLCAGTHDFRDPAMPLIRSTITVHDGVWICADAFVGPNVEIHKNAIVGAGAVLLRHVENDVIVGGNPAKPIGKR